LREEIIANYRLDVTTTGSSFIYVLQTAKDHSDQGILEVFRLPPKLFWVPAVVGVEKRDPLALTFEDTGVPSRGKTFVALGDNRNTVAIGLQNREGIVS
jgi:hypothetical protein